jgi:hypothetical protein
LGIFYEHFSTFVVIWHIFPRSGILYQEKSGNPVRNRHDKGPLKTFVIVVSDFCSVVLFKYVSRKLLPKTLLSRDRCYGIFVKKFGEKLAFFAQATATFRKKFYHNIGLREKRQLFRRKLAKIAEICDHSTDPRQEGMHHTRDPMRLKNGPFVPNDEKDPVNIQIRLDQVTHRYFYFESRGPRCPKFVQKAFFRKVSFRNS